MSWIGRDSSLQGRPDVSPLCSSFPSYQLQLNTLHFPPMSLRACLAGTLCGRNLNSYASPFQSACAVNFGMGRCRWLTHSCERDQTSPALSCLLWSFWDAGLREVLGGTGGKHSVGGSRNETFSHSQRPPKPDLHIQTSRLGGYPIYTQLPMLNMPPHGLVSFTMAPTQHSPSTSHSPLYVLRVSSFTLTKYDSTHPVPTPSRKRST